jgi:hypothetical protein
MTNNKQQTGVQWFFDQLVANRIIVINGSTYWDKVKTKYEILMEQAQEMEKEKHEKFNKFLNDEKQLGISDLKTIERIQWYYNTYFNETYGGGEQ